MYVQSSYPHPVIDTHTNGSLQEYRPRREGKQKLSIQRRICMTAELDANTSFIPDSISVRPTPQESMVRVPPYFSQRFSRLTVFLSLTTLNHP